MERSIKDNIASYCVYLLIMAFFSSVIYFFEEIIRYIQDVLSYFREHISWILGIGACVFSLFAISVYLYEFIREKFADKKAKEFTYEVSKKYPLSFEVFLQEERVKNIEDFSKWHFRNAIHKEICWWEKTQEEEIERLRKEKEREELKSKYPFGFDCWHEEHKYDKLVDLECKEDIAEYDRLCILKNNVRDFFGCLREMNSLQFSVLSSLRDDVKIYDKNVSSEFKYMCLKEVKLEDYHSLYKYVKQEEKAEFSLNSYFMFNFKDYAIKIDKETEQKVQNVISTLGEQLFDFLVYDSTESVKCDFLCFWKNLLDSIKNKNVNLLEISSLDTEMMQADNYTKIAYLSFLSSTERETKFSNNFYNNYSNKYPCLSFISIFEDLSGLEEKTMRLTDYTQKTKKDYVEICELLKEKKIKRLYHFTSVNNVESIIQNGGLYSWYSAANNNVSIANPGGGTTSRSQDIAHGVQDYVHLSFCMDHPMSYKLTQKLIYTVLVYVDPVVCYFEDTVFSDINAADNNCRFGKDMEALKLVDFSAVRSSYIRKTDPKFKKHQAEVMVPKFIPLKYITNLEQLQFDLDYYKSHKDDIVKRLKEECGMY